MVIERRYLLLLALLVFAVGAGATILLLSFNGMKMPWQMSESQLIGPAAPLIAKIDGEPPFPNAGLPDVVPDAGILLKIEPEKAVEINASRPFSTQPIIPAQPYVTQLSGMDYERAEICLAIAAYYEAGDSVDDQRPVMQVILNRTRHKAFPKSICGVVFQGAQRQTGCQFSFACDGSMARRRPSAPQFLRARGLARQMMAGAVDKRVGLATHYHTNWVVPYWSDSLDKVTAIKTHLFFVWKGYWGQQKAFLAPLSLIEPIVPALAAYSVAHGGIEIANGEEVLPPPFADDFGSTAEIDGAVGDGVAPFAAGQNQNGGPPVPMPIMPQIPIYRIELNSDGSPGRWALDSLKICGKLRECRVVGWTPTSPAPSQMTAEAIHLSPPDFVFVQDLRNRQQLPYWRCDKWPKAATSACLNSADDASRVATNGL